MAKHHGHRIHRKHAAPLPTPALYIIVVLCTVLGLVLTVAGFKLRASQKDLTKRCTLETNALCVDIKIETNTSKNAKTTKSFYPVLRYEVNGQSYTSKANLSTSHEDVFAKGKWYIIKVDPDNPEDYTYDAEDEANMLTSTCLIIAGLLIIISFAGIFIYVSKTRKESEGSEEFIDETTDTYL